ncbi:MAG: chain-length determining protein, partial [Bacteroidaceae bacterium]|nr:chain-length determining protein [Bacteroidaceae bacterium]
MEQKVKTTNELDIIGMLKKVLLRKDLLFKTILVSGILGVIIAFSRPKEFTTNVVLAPESSSGLDISQGLSGLASMVGINMGAGGSSDAIYPEIYPDLFTSSDFIVTLFDIKVHTTKDPKDKLYLEHIIKDSKKSPLDFFTMLIKKIKSLFSDEGVKKNLNDVDPRYLTKEQDAMCIIIRSRIRCIVDKKTNMITISATDQDAVTSAILADTLQRRLQKYITDYRTQKARKDLDYIQKLYYEAKAQYEHSQKLYAEYVDSHRGAILQSYIIQQEKLSNDVQLNFQIFNQ